MAVIRLARTSKDGPFANIEEVGTTLELPVVAVVPAVKMHAPTAPGPAKIGRGVRLIGQLLLALVVFAVVAYFVQAPGRGWGLNNDAVESVTQAIERVGKYR